MGTINLVRVDAASSARLRRVHDRERNEGGPRLQGGEMCLGAIWPLEAANATCGSSLKHGFAEEGGNATTRIDGGKTDGALPYCVLHG